MSLKVNKQFIYCPLCNKRQFIKDGKTYKKCNSGNRKIIYNVDGVV